MGAQAWRRRNGGLPRAQCPSIVYGSSASGLAWRPPASEAHVLGLVPKRKLSSAQARYTRKPPNAVSGRAGMWEHRPGADGMAASHACRALP